MFWLLCLRMNLDFCWRSCPFELCETWNSALGLAQHDSVMEHGLIPAHLHLLRLIVNFPLHTWVTTHLHSKSELGLLPQMYIWIEILRKYLPKIRVWYAFESRKPLGIPCRVLGSCQNLMPGLFNLVLGFVVKCSHSISMLCFFCNSSSTYLSMYISFHLYSIMLFILVYYMYMEVILLNYKTWKLWPRSRVWGQN